MEADVTAVEESDVGSGFRFMLDFGCFHDELSDVQRLGEGRAGSALAAPGATLPLWAVFAGAQGPVAARCESRRDRGVFPERSVVDGVAAA